MKKFIQTIKNIFSIEDLRIRILNTIGFLVIYRLGSFIVLPGVNPDSINREANQNNILGVLDSLVGGAFSNVSIFGLGIMPYISASIVLQLLTFAVPYFQKLQKEGESGRKKINQFTRTLTIAIAGAQAFGYLTATVGADMLYPGVNSVLFNFSSVIILTSGTIFCMWLGERITDKGIGNGISMLIMVGIISRFPHALIYEAAVQRGAKGALWFVIELVVLFFIVMGVVMLTQATRRIPVQYAKQVIGNKVYGGQRQYIPLKVIAAGVMPIIFAQSIMFLPSMLASVSEESDFALYIKATFNDFTTWEYNVLFAVLIILFTFFYTALSVNPNQISDDMKRNGGFIPGIKPGKQTSEFIDNILSKITLPGSIFLALVAILPALAYMTGISRDFSYFFGGTSLLIMVGVILDTLQQIESYLLMRHYEGMMKSGRLKGRSQNAAVA
jgi:preprotein translocase subunit SecY